MTPRPLVFLPAAPTAVPSLSLHSGGEAFVVETRRWILAILHHLQSPAQGREDLAQEVLLRLLRQEQAGRRGFRGQDRGEWFRYVSVVTRRTWADEVRRRLTAKRDSRIELSAGDSLTPDLTTLASRSVDPLRRCLEHEQRRLFHRACSGTVAHRRDRRRALRILRLAWLEGHSSRDIARRMRRGLRPATIDSLLSRARTRLRRITGGDIPRRASPRTPRLAARRRSSRRRIPG